MQLQTKVFRHAPPPTSPLSQMVVASIHSAQAHMPVCYCHQARQQAWLLLQLLLLLGLFLSFFGLRVGLRDELRLLDLLLQLLRSRGLLRYCQGTKPCPHTVAANTRTQQHQQGHRRWRAAAARHEQV